MRHIILTCRSGHLAANCTFTTTYPTLEEVWNKQTKFMDKNTQRHSRAIPNYYPCFYLVYLVIRPGSAIRLVDDHCCKYSHNVKTLMSTRPCCCCCCCWWALIIMMTRRWLWWWRRVTSAQRWQTMTSAVYFILTATKSLSSRLGHAPSSSVRDEHWMCTDVTGCNEAALNAERRRPHRWKQVGTRPGGRCDTSITEK